MPRNTIKCPADYPGAHDLRCKCDACAPWLAKRVPLSDRLRTFRNDCMEAARFVRGRTYVESREWAVILVQQAREWNRELLLAKVRERAQRRGLG